MIQDLKIGLLQYDIVWEDIQANLAHIEENIAEIEGAIDLLILPEMFQTGFTMNAEKLAEPMNGHTTKWMKHLAKRIHAMVCGSIICKVDSQFYNRFLWVDWLGNIDFYDKKHLFSLQKEDQIYQPGKKNIIKNIHGWNIIPQICYDLRFPESCRNLIDAAGNYQYDLALYVANWPSVRDYAWNQLLAARAIENSCYSIGLNRIGKDGRGFSHSGNSVVCSPLEVLSRSGSEASTMVITLSRSYLEEYRSKYPFLADRKF